MLLIDNQLHPALQQFVLFNGLTQGIGTSDLAQQSDDLCTGYRVLRIADMVFDCKIIALSEIEPIDEEVLFSVR